MSATAAPSILVVGAGSIGARHARNLQQVPKVSLMLIEDENGARELFARKRLTFDAVAEVVARDDVRWEKAIAALEGRFGEIVRGLSNLKDFVLFRLKPEQGLFVKGFGQAFRVSGDEPDRQGGALGAGPGQGGASGCLGLTQLCCPRTAKP